MKIFRRIYVWWFNNVQLLNTILLIIIVAQLFFYWNIKFFNQTIIPIAYLVSVFYLIKTFRESQNRNKMEFGKGLYEKHAQNIFKMKNQIIEENIIGKKLLPQYVSAAKLTSNNLNVINLIIKIMIGNIGRHKEFSTYIKQLNNKDVSLINNKDESYTELNTQYKMIYDLLDSIGELARKFLGLYNDILQDKDFMSWEQSKLLSRDIDEFLSGYYLLCEEIIKKEDISGIYFINDIIKYKGFDENHREPPYAVEKDFSKLYPEYFTDFYREINKIKKKLLS